jgi:hypothetical protein
LFWVLQSDKPKSNQAKTMFYEQNRPWNYRQQHRLLRAHGEQQHLSGWQGLQQHGTGLAPVSATT